VTRGKPLVTRRDLYVIEAVLWLAVLWSIGELMGAWRLAVRVIGPIVKPKLERLTGAETARVETVFKHTSVGITGLNHEPAGSWRQGAVVSAADAMQRRMDGRWEA
jgi:hypothetical protein